MFRLLKWIVFHVSLHVMLLLHGHQDSCWIHTPGFRPVEWFCYTCIICCISHIQPLHWYYVITFMKLVVPTHEHKHMCLTGHARSKLLDIGWLSEVVNYIICRISHIQPLYWYYVITFVKLVVPTHVHVHMRLASWGSQNKVLKYLYYSRDVMTLH